MSVVKDVTSRVRERTLEIWVPSDRWIPLHSIQRIIPRLMETHSVLTSEPQSAHQQFPLSASRKIWSNFAGLSSKLWLSVRT